MSCNCNHTNNVQQFACSCDGFVHPAKPAIGMGLTNLPRQIAGFPEFRRAMLLAIRAKDPSGNNKIALDAWQAKQQDDLGVMMLEMWAYICDSLCFYDKVIAQEEYVRTAMRRPSLRKLVALTGYLPRPAVGAYVYLTALAEGRLKLSLPAKTAFRSSGFNGNPPQVFETDEELFIHPLTSKWNVKAPRPDVTETENPDKLLIVPKTDIQPGGPLLIIDTKDNRYTQALWIKEVAGYTGADSNLYTRLAFSEKAALPYEYPLKHLQIQVSAQSAGLWPNDKFGGDSIALNGLYRQIKPGQFVVISSEKKCRWFTVMEVKEALRSQSAGDTITINQSAFQMPGVSVMVTTLTLDKPVDKEDGKAEGGNWSGKGLMVHFLMQPAGIITNEQKTTLSSDDPVCFNENPGQPVDGYTPSTFFLTDKNSSAVKLNGNIRYDNSSLNIPLSEKWAVPMVLPVEAFGNVIRASRGETVVKEILGSGDATLSNQSFKLKKKPLTYFAAPSVAGDRGLKNTLQVYVSGIRWREVRSFFNSTETDEVYIVRQNDEGDSFVTFGDGGRGCRLPAGIDNITATYRFGAGAAVPPANTITQISKPVKDFGGINNPLPAWGGADAETPGELQSMAPKSILTLGRIVSMQDAEAVALTVPGVQAVQVEWRWNMEKQCPLVHIWYAGSNGVEETLTGRLRSMSDPSIVMLAQMAEAIPVTLTLDLQMDARFVSEDVQKEVRNAFTGIETGLLTRKHIRIGKSLFRSKIFAAALSVKGVLSVKNILFRGQPFSAFAESPGPGKYFDLTDEGLIVTINQ